MRRQLAVLLALCLGAAGCQSTQDRNRELAKKGAHLINQKGLTITRQSADVKVVSTAVLTDPNGTAAVVELRNRSKRALASVPVAIDVEDGHGRSVFKNNAPGLEPSLTGVSVLQPGESLLWVDDQVQPAGTAATVKAEIGLQRGSAPASLPKIAVSRPQLLVDPTSGVNASGVVTNDSNVMQRKLVIFAVARKGGRIVAAGRGGVPRLLPHRRAHFHIFFIGDPRGAQLELAAPPSVL